MRGSQNQDLQNLCKSECVGSSRPVSWPSPRSLRKQQTRRAGSTTEGQPHRLRAPQGGRRSPRRTASGPGGSCQCCKSWWCWSTFRSRPSSTEKQDGFTALHKDGHAARRADLSRRQPSPTAPCTRPPSCTPVLSPCLECSPRGPSARSSSTSCLCFSPPWAGVSPPWVTRYYLFTLVSCFLIVPSLDRLSLFSLYPCLNKYLLLNVIFLLHCNEQSMMSGWRNTHGFALLELKVR